MGNNYYRKDIDGLRAFAIIPVVLFHSGFDIFSGGYVGVDVFFVISGFLITSILIKEMENGTFSFKSFFIRRIRRLMPMALFIYLTVLIVYALYYPVTHFKDVSAASLSSLGFVSNIYFWQQGGYFTPNLEMNPLLHTWSLSVEEQFYLTFPFLLLLIVRLTSSKIFQLLALFLVTSISIVLAIIYAPTFYSYAGFYLLPTRMYELGVGALIAIFVVANPLHSVRNLPYLKEIGLLLIMVPVFLFDEGTEFPSYNALFPVTGAGLIMLSSRDGGIIDSLLKVRLIVLIGLISYSLYLWHWPAIVLKNWLMNDQSTWMIDISVILICILLSWMTYRYVETPFRNKKVIPDLKLIRYASISASLLVLLTVLGLVYGNAFIVDPDGRITDQYSKAVEPEPYRDECTNKIRFSSTFDYCELEPPLTISNPKKIFVWGDSHGSAFMPVIEGLQDEYLIRFSNTTGCPPVLGLKRTDMADSPCIRVNDLVYSHLSEENYDLVIMVGAYNNYLNWGLVGSVDAVHSRDVKESAKDFKRNLTTTLNNLDGLGYTFLIVSQAPRFDESIPDAYVRSETLGVEVSGTEISYEQYEKQLAPFLSSIGDEWSERIVSFSDIYCPAGVCLGISGTSILYKDSHHISNDLARVLSSNFKDEVVQALSAIN